MPEVQRATDRGQCVLLSPTQLHRCTDAWPGPNHCRLLPQFEASGARGRVKLRIHILNRQKVIGRSLCICRQVKYRVAVVRGKLPRRLPVLFTNV
jgi:hypothetical protein